MVHKPSDQKPEATQPTQPRGIDPTTGEPYEPGEIPVPKREDVLRDLRKIAAADEEETGEGRKERG